MVQGTDNTLLQAPVQDIIAFFVSLFESYINVPVQHMRAIQGQTEACLQDTMPYSYDRLLGIFYMHYYTDTITHGRPVVGTGGSESITQ